MKKDITVFFDVPIWQILLWIDFLNNKEIIPFLKNKSLIFTQAKRKCVHFESVQSTNNQLLSTANAKNINTYYYNTISTLASRYRELIAQRKGRRPATE